MKRYIHRGVPIAASLGLLASCASPEVLAPPPTDVEVSVQEVRTGQGQGHKYLSLDVLATAQGQAIACEDGEVDVRVSVSPSKDGPFEEASDIDVRVRCTRSEGADMAIVVDNSGSEEGYLPWLQEAAHLMVDALIPRQGRASLVRVSTDSQTLQPLTDDAEALRGTIDELYIRNGWTALFDGIRMGNETLASLESSQTESDDMGDFCSTDRKLGIVVFTDGRENNSAHQSLRSDEYPGDGLDTTLEDLYKLQVNDVVTPIYTVGLGENVDRAGLADLATATGGRHHQIASETDLPAVFQTISEYASASHKLCTELPPDLCGDMYVKVDYSWSYCAGGDCAPGQAEAVTGSNIHKINVDCPLERNGNVATLLLTLSNPGIDRDVAKTLAANTVNWVSPVDEPRVLIVRDGNHHGEFKEDTRYVHDLLAESGFDITYQEEPLDGLTAADTGGYDVVWFSNPGYPPDDKASINALRAFSDAGGGFVLQGDDTTWVWGDRGYSLTPVTGLVHQNNGTKFCDRRIDNNDSGNRYHVMFEGETHPVIAGLEGAELLYGDDIDTSFPAEQGEQVLAWANGADAGGNIYCEKQVPVVVVRTPAE